MPVQPQPGDVHIDQALTDLSVRFTTSTQDYIAARAFPIVNVSHKSDKYYTYPRSYWFRTDVQKRAPGAESAGGGYEISSADYSAEVYAFHRDIDDQTRANADTQVTLERDATEFVTQNLLQYREQQWASTFFAASVWTNEVTLSGTDQWDDYANSDPIDDMRTAAITLRRTTGQAANKLILGPEVWNKLQDHPSFLERIKYTERAVVGTQLLASMIGVDEVLVPMAVRNPNAEGASVAAGDWAFHLGKHALFLHSPSRSGLGVPAAGYTFNWSGLVGSGSNGIRMKRYRLERNASDRIEGEMAWDMKVVSADLGYFIQNAVS